jgi:hypothetical protein
MRNISKKRLAVIAGGTAAVMAGAGIGYAYWTTTGSGSGSAGTGNVSRNITMTASNSTDKLVPGGDAIDLTLTANNPNTYSANISGDSLSLTKVTCGTTVVTDNHWFQLVNSSLAGAAVLAPTEDDQSVTPTTPVSIKMVDDATKTQDVCKNTAVTFTFDAG